MKNENEPYIVFINVTGLDGETPSFGPFDTLSQAQEFIDMHPNPDRYHAVPSRNWTEQ